MVPLARNKIRVRIECISDSYDNESQYITFNMREFAEALYFIANNKMPNYVNIQEMSLTGNQPRSEMLKNKIHWKTLDDSNVLPQFTDNDIDVSKLNMYSVTMHNQMIKVFELEYIPDSSTNDNQAFTH